jgi:NADH dehydrogenase [ubiquinone] 1 alpha subcomplex assembly factor 1
MTARAGTSLCHVAALGLTGLAITMNAHAASERILFDFQAPNNSPAWQIVNDDVMGGVSTSSFQILANGGAVFSGVVSLEKNGGFASVRSAPARHNLMTSGCFVIRLRGDGRRYKFTVRTETGFNTPLYQCAFVTKLGEWEEHRLAFKDFVPTFRGHILTDVPPLNPGRVTSIGLLISEKQDGPFQLEVAWIKAAPPSGD